ncbi:MAG: fasciclin domain-containing protein, partial [Pirellulales bacterium]|nr:fasciclin domain-containing protein [Pirellulales bacterium]
MVNTLFLPELREMLAESNQAELKEFCIALNAGRTAEFMEGLTDEEVWQVLQYAEADRRAEIFGYFDEERQVAMLQTHEPAEVAELVEALASDDRVDLLQDLPNDRVELILPLLPVEDRRDIQRLQSYPEGTAGSLMTTEVAMLGEKLTARLSGDTIVITDAKGRATAVTQADVRTSNGVIHVTDGVFLP